MSAPTINEMISAVSAQAREHEGSAATCYSRAKQDRLAEVLDAATETLKRMPPESLARIGLMVLEQWSEGYSEIETIDVQELAVKAGALVETTFDPEQHSDEHGAAEFGDVWLLFSDEVNKYRAIPTQDDAKAPGQRSHRAQEGQSEISI